VTARHPLEKAATAIFGHALQIVAAAAGLRHSRGPPSNDLRQNAALQLSYCMESKALTLWTIGHSTRSIEDFIALLITHKILVLADVRQFPGSRRHPQFGQDALAKSLADASIEYVHFPELGGRRRPQANSPNTAWRNEAFRGYA